MIRKLTLHKKYGSLKEPYFVELTLFALPHVFFHFIFRYREKCTLEYKLQKTTKKIKKLFLF